MPCAGEEPITSFFHRIPANQTRRRTSDTWQRKRRRTNSTEANVPSAKITRSSAVGLEGFDAPTTPASRLASSIMSSNSTRINQLPTPHSRRSIRTPFPGSLPTPPPTRLLLKTSAHPLHHKEGRNTSPLTQSDAQRSGKHLPNSCTTNSSSSPTTLTFCQLGQQAPRSDIPVAEYRQTKSGPPSSLIPISNLVPSSQSQDSDVGELCLERLAAQKTLENTAHARSHSNFETSFVDDHHCVQSSQSQYLMSHCASPRKKNPELRSPSPPSSDSTTSSFRKEIVPSSQSSTEGELDVLKPFPYRSHPKDLAGCGLSSNQNVTPTRRHTSSQQPLSHVLQSAHRDKEGFRVPVVPEDSGSVTEESEDEHIIATPSLYNDNRESSVLSDMFSTQSTTDYPSSLPDVVKEFRDMFDGDDYGNK